MAGNFHISPKTGKAAVCKATEEPCPLLTSDGQPMPHFETKLEAEKWYETKNQDRTLQTPLSKTPPLASQTPSDLDNQLAEFYYQTVVNQDRADAALADAQRIAARVYKTVTNPQEIQDTWDTTLQRLLDEEEAGSLHPNGHAALRSYRTSLKFHEESKKAREEGRPFHQEFERRGGWSRAFLVSNSNGHVHSSMNCSSCFPTTRYEWVTDFSGKNEDEIIEAAGERACTVCFPNAPVATLNKPTQMFTKEERDKAARKDAREQAALAKKQKQIAAALTPDGSPFTTEFTDWYGHASKESFKTERTATTWVIDGMIRSKLYPHTDQSAKEARDRVVSAIAEKHGRSFDEVEAELVKKAEAKSKRLS